MADFYKSNVMEGVFRFFEFIIEYPFLGAFLFGSWSTPLACTCFYSIIETFLLPVIYLFFCLLQFSLLFILVFVYYRLSLFFINYETSVRYELSNTPYCQAPCCQSLVYFMQCLTCPLYVSVVFNPQFLFLNSNFIDNIQRCWVLAAQLFLVVILYICHLYTITC